MKLKIFREDKLLDTKTLGQDQLLKIGRLRSSAIYLEESDVARMHAVIENQSGIVRIIDLGSSGGTYLNDTKIDKNAEVKLGDQIKIGGYHIVVEDGDDEDKDEKPDVNTTVNADAFIDGIAAMVKELPIEAIAGIAKAKAWDHLVAYLDDTTTQNTESGITAVIWMLRRDLES